MQGSVFAHPEPVAPDVDQMAVMHRTAGEEPKQLVWTEQRSRDASLRQIALSACCSAMPPTRKPEQNCRISLHPASRGRHDTLADQSPGSACMDLACAYLAATSR